jgi:hypothetical protein
MDRYGRPDRIGASLATADAYLALRNAGTAALVVVRRVGHV